jgi:hypothetical protein
MEKYNNLKIKKELFFWIIIIFLSMWKLTRG